MIQHVLVAADRFQMDRLRTVCEALLSSRLDVATAAQARPPQPLSLPPRERARGAPGGAASGC